MPAEPQDVVIRLDGRERLRLRGAVVRTAHGSGRYAFFAASEVPSPAIIPSTQPAGTRERYVLRPVSGAGASVTCDITRDGPDRAAVTLSSADVLPDIRLLGATPTRMLPARVLDDDAGATGPAADVVQTAIGPVVHGHVNALIDPSAGDVMKIDGRVTYELARDGTVLAISPPEPRGSRHEVLTIRLQERRAGGTAEAAQSSVDLEPAPAGWSGCGRGSGVTDEDLLRTARWMSANLAPFGAVHFAADGMPLPEAPGSTPGGDIPAAVDALGLDAIGCREGGLAGMYELPERPETQAVTHLPLHDPRSPGFEDHRRLWDLYLRLLCADGLDCPFCRRDPGSPVLADASTLDRVRSWASLIGLNGLALMTADRVDMLPAERVEVLRRACPPAPVRVMDLFPRCGHREPVVWALRIAGDHGRWDVLGVFNFQPEPARRQLRLGELGIPAGDTEQFAVYDFWGEQLLAVTADAFDVHLAPDSCRVLCVRRLEPRRPTLISTSRHLTQGVLDLAELSYDEAALTLSGTSSVVANDPYELRIFTGDGPDSFEITEVQCGPAICFARSAGPIAIVTVESPQSASLDWTIRFARVARHPGPPRSPRNLRATQTTRGVLLRWDGKDERAASQRVYRDETMIAEIAGRVHEYSDSDVVYARRYRYAISAVDCAGRESSRSEMVTHTTPVPADAHLTQLVPLKVVHGHRPLNVNRSAGGNRLRIAGRRYFRGLGASPGTSVTYFLGGGYETFTGEVGIDDETRGSGSAVFEIHADGERLFTSGVMRGGQPGRQFSVPLAGRQRLTLVVSDAGDGPEGDHADWGDTYLRVAADTAPPAVPQAPETATEPAAAVPPDLLQDDTPG